ncbi:hypothetical protein [Streptomyces sp. NPDC096311]|uniref:hypothetical protein n=1 Tax=Streptomyces sp. NPDC096311 TaxID=3366083 RepID=UPI00382D695F
MTSTRFRRPVAAKAPAVAGGAELGTSGNLGFGIGGMERLAALPLLLWTLTAGALGLLHRARTGAASLEPDMPRVARGV